MYVHTSEEILYFDTHNSLNTDNFIVNSTSPASFKKALKAFIWNSYWL